MPQESPLQTACAAMALPAKLVVAEAEAVADLASGGELDELSERLCAASLAAGIAQVAFLSRALILEATAMEMTAAAELVE